MPRLLLLPPTLLTLLLSTTTNAQSTNSSYWQPTSNTPWSINLSTSLPTSCPPNVTAIDGDLFSNPSSTFSSLQASGCKTICYFSAGSFENWRPDASSFNQTTDIGAPLQGWQGEWWVNTKSENVRSIMQKRLDLAKQKGCDAVDPDNIDAYDNDGGGLGLTTQDAVDYVTFLANEAHSRGMAMGLKNGGAIVADVLGSVQFEVNEQCQRYSECDTFTPFVSANKPVFNIEYTTTQDTIPSTQDVDGICGQAAGDGFETVIKHMDLGSWGIECAVVENGGNGTTTTAGAANGTTDGNGNSGCGRNEVVSVLSFVGLGIAMVQML